MTNFDVTLAPLGSVLDWMSQNHIDPQRAAPLVQLGVVGSSDLERLTRCSSFFHVEAEALARYHRDVAPVVIPVSIIESHLELVGHSVLARDLDNVDIWRPLADRIQVLHRRSHPPVWSAPTLTEAMAAGRSPSFVAELLAVAEAAAVPVNAFGFNPEVSPTVLRDLTDAGVRSQGELDVFLDAGLSFADALDLARLGAQSLVVRAAHASGHPIEEWRRTLPGLNPQWFSSENPTGGILAAPAVTWDVLRTFADSGWLNVEQRMLTSNYGWKHDSFYQLTVAAIMEAIDAGLTFDQADAWAKGLTAGGGHGNLWDNAVLPFHRGRISLSKYVPVMVALRDAGVRPTWLDEYRSSGCRTTDDVLKAVAAGIDKKRATELRQKFGHDRGNGRQPRFKSVSELLQAHTGKLDQRIRG